MKRMLLSLTLALIATCGARAETASPIKLKAPWLRATPRSAPVAGGYVSIVNTGVLPDRLIGASLPIAADGQVHSMSMVDGVMHMQRLDAGLPIPPGGTIVLTPGGDHLMFIKPTRQLKEGESVEGRLVFEKAGAISVTFVVGGMAAKTAPGAKARDTKGMDHMDRPGMKGMDMSRH